MRETDVVIVGAGPIGIELAVGLKRAGIEYLHLEAGQVGATMQWWAPGTKYFSSPERIEIAGVPLVVADQEKANREHYLDYLRTVVGTHGLAIETYRRVLGIRRLEGAGGDGSGGAGGAGGFELRVGRSYHGVGGAAEVGDGPHVGGEEEFVRARRVVLAIGDMHRPRLIGVAGEDLPHVSHFLGDVHQYANQRVVIVGGKNSAVEAAIRLFRAGARVTMSYRGAWFDPDRIKYWLYPEIEYLIKKKGKIGYRAGSVVREITPRDVVLRTGEGMERVAADFVLLMTGYEQDPFLFEELGVELVGEERKPRIDLKTMETNVAGVYVAGTASAGSQRRTRVFIETSHVHVDRIVAALQGRVSEVEGEEFGLEEA